MNHQKNAEGFWDEFYYQACFGEQGYTKNSLRDVIEDSYARAINDDLPPNVFANIVLALFDAVSACPRCLSGLEPGGTYYCDDCMTTWDEDVLLSTLEIDNSADKK